MVERHKGWTVSVLIALLILSGCKQGNSRKEFLRVGKTYLTPERVKKGEAIELVFETISEKGEIELEIEWKRDGFLIEGANSSELSSFYFNKGDSIRADVTVKSSGKVVRVINLGPVVCINSPPAVSNVEISTRDSTALSARVEHEDVDGDSVTIIKKWYRNGNSVHDGETFTTGLLQRGDKVMVEVIPYDGEEEGRPVKSAPILAGNHPPRIVSAPPRIKGEHYIYQIDAEDKDGDLLSYSVRYGPDGMRIDSSGSLSWAKGEEADSVYTVQVEVLDGYGGSAVQEFQLRIREGTE